MDLSYLKPILLALFAGNTEEKAKSKGILLKLMKQTKSGTQEQEADLVDWLWETKESSSKDFPRQKGIDNLLTMRLIVKKGILSYESVKFAE